MRDDPSIDFTAEWLRGIAAANRANPAGIDDATRVRIRELLDGFTLRDIAAAGPELRDATIARVAAHPPATELRTSRGTNCFTARAHEAAIVVLRELDRARREQQPPVTIDREQWQSIRIQSTDPNDTDCIEPWPRNPYPEPVKFAVLPGAFGEGDGRFFGERWGMSAPAADFYRSADDETRRIWTDPLPVVRDDDPDPTRK